MTCTDTLFFHRSTGVVSPKTELSQPKSQSCSSWKSHFGIGSRSEISMNGMTPPLYPFPLAFHPVNEASCRPPSPLPKPGAFASHVGGGGSGVCQSLADIPCNVVGGGPVNPSGERGVDHCVADQSVSLNGTQVSRQLLTPRGRLPTTDPRKIAVLVKVVLCSATITLI